MLKKLIVISILAIIATPVLAALPSTVSEPYFKKVGSSSFFLKHTDYTYNLSNESKYITKTSSADKLNTQSVSGNISFRVTQIPDVMPDIFFYSNDRDSLIESLGYYGSDVTHVIEINYQGVNLSQGILDLKLLPKKIFVNADPMNNKFFSFRLESGEMINGFPDHNAGGYEPIKNVLNSCPGCDMAIFVNLADKSSNNHLVFNFLDNDTVYGNSTQLMLVASEVPVPAAFWLFGSALLGLARLKK